jgi:hypothetical protein|tara:strand:+ start:845 stop:1033 length:189 start_codon:yes stop_codon:yes gene_type:complete
MICINNTIQAHALAKDTPKASSIGAQEMVTGLMTNSRLIKLEAAKITGIDIKNEKRAAASRV